MMTAMTRPTARPRRTWTGAALAVVAALLTTSCAADGAGEAGAERTAGPVKPASTFIGNYLAGRHAQATRDISAAADFLSAALNWDPESKNLLRRTFVLMTAEGRMDEAVPLAHKVIATHEKAPIANIVVVVDQIKTGRYEDAETHLAGLPQNGINNFMVPLLSAWTQVGFGRPDEALKALTPLSRNKGFKALFDLHTALVNEASGRTEAAEKGYLSAAKNQGGLSLRLAQLLGALYERRGDTEMARDVYAQYRKLHPGSQLLSPAMTRIEKGTQPPLEVATATDGAAEGLFGVASSLRQQNADETALVFGRLALYLRPNFPVMQILVADILEADNRLDKANAIYADIDPASPIAWSARLRIASNLNKMDRADDAVKQLRSMALDRPTQAEPLISLGDILRGRDRYQEAVDAYDQAVKRIDILDRRHWSLLYARGIVLERSEQWPRAEADFLKALEFEPEQPYVLNYLGYSWVEKGLNLDRALGMIKKAVSLRPNDGYIVDSLGWVHYRLGEFEDAVRELERAVELRPEDPVINDHLGDAYWRVGRHQEARFQWLRALGLEPEPDLVETVKAKLEKGLIKKVADGGNG
jgi:tetratricopeptide (TPR) repeat protein